MGQRHPSASSRVLLVESNAIIGVDLADQLERGGYEVAGPFACAAAAKWLQSRTPDLAVLDVDLQSGPCVELARELRQRGVPLLIFSAHDRQHALAEFRCLRWLPMPAPRDALHIALQAL